MGAPDADVDAIPDFKDQCPNLPGDLASKGCPLLDANANGSLQDEMEALEEPRLLKAIHQHQKDYWWLKEPGILGNIKLVVKYNTKCNKLIICIILIFYK